MLRSINSISSTRLTFESIRTFSTPSSAAASQSDTKGEQIKIFEIYRYNPEKPDVKPYLQVYYYYYFFCTINLLLLNFYKIYFA